jgi:hypothetical protein
VEHRYAALVRGSSAIFPRGYLWLIPVWYAAIAVLFEIKGKPPSWYAVSILAATLLAVLTLLTVLTTVRSNAFVADGSGVWLGLRGGARRRFGPRRRQYAYLPWSDVWQVRIAAKFYGARLDIVLPAGSAGWRHPVREFIAAVVTLVLPVSYLFRSPGLLLPRHDPPRYRIPLYDVTPEELRLALAPLVPPTVAIGVRPRWRTRALRRLRMRRSRLTTAA